MNQSYEVFCIRPQFEDREARETLVDELLGAQELREAGGALAKDRAKVFKNMDPQACYRIGCCYACGDGVAEDQRQAWLWYGVASISCIRAVSALLENGNHDRYNPPPYPLCHRA